MKNRNLDNYHDLISLTKELIKFPSFSGKHDEVINFIDNFLRNNHFTTQQLEFSGNNSYPVNNLWAIFNSSAKKNLYFAGHSDVVAVGDLAKWSFPPFLGSVNLGKIFGRGAVDMKGAIACFLMATQDFLIKYHYKIDFGIGFLITNDEESDSINGTKKMLQWLEEKNHQIDCCIVGEPTNPNEIGEMIKIGRRGSVNFQLKIIGKQGHVAYPENAINPNKILIDILHQLQIHVFDNGNEFFDPTNLEITSINSDNLGNNVIPEFATANFNIRFNNLHKSQKIIELIQFVCEKNAIAMKAKIDLQYKVSGEAFLSQPHNLADITKNAIKKITNKTTIFSTTGGTSDARFIKSFANEVIEFGLINKTAHQIDENVEINDLISLYMIYQEILENFNKI